MIQPNEKMRWAKKHLDALDEHMRDLASKIDSKRVSTYDDTERGEYVATITFDDPDFEAALIAGDFISSLRSSLDYLVWQLARLNSEEPSRNLGFPVFEEDTLKTQLRITEMTYGIPDEAIVTIKSLQPYIYGKSYEVSSLWKLHSLWNIVKHRHIGACSRITSIHFPNTIPVLSAKQICNSYVMRFPLSAKPNVSFNPMPEVTVDIQFGDVRKGPVVMVGNLAEIHQFVSSAVLPKFERFFPK